MKNKIINIINKVGIKDVGFCAFKDVENQLLDCRARCRLPKGAKTVIVCLFPYKVKEESPKNISRYAAVPDYHTVCGKYLEEISNQLKQNIEGYQFEWFVDNSPIPEKRAAALAGLGVIGKNDLLINQKYGSFVFIGEIVTDLEIEATGKAVKTCNNCGICLKNCPKVIEGIDCLSSISQKKGELDKKENELLRKYKIIWGCDICADVCPLNIDKINTYIKEFIDGYRDCYTIDEDITGRAFEWRGKNTVKRNAFLQEENKNG